LAHEIRNPLAPISNALAVMQRVGPDDPLQLEMRSMIGRQAQRLTRIADDMLDISRVTRGRLAVRSDVIDVADLIRDAVEASVPMIEEAEHSLVVEAASEALFIKGDRERLIQVLFNLVNNAARFTPKGGSIAIGARRESEHIAVSVRDSGRGIAKD